MRLLLVVSLLSNQSSGLGGHYNSVRDLREAFLRDWPDASVDVLIIGNIRPAAFTSDDGIHFVSSVDKPLRGLVQGALAAGERIDPTHVHAFDNKSYAFARAIAHRTGAKRYLTRPGGPNPTTYFPRAPDIICFSAENSEYLRAQRKHRRARVHLLPQRVLEPPRDEARISELAQLTAGRPVLLRIARITSLNAPSLRQTVALSRLLRESGIDHSLVIVGSPNDDELVAEIKGALSEQDALVTESNFTKKAEELTGVARAVVGSGRTLIEAAMAEKVLYAPLAESSTPVLVTDANWELLARANFSARSTLPKGELADVKSLVEGFSGADSSVARTIASHYRIDGQVTARYRAIYEAPQNGRREVVDGALNWLAFAVPYLKTRLTRTRER